MKRLKLLILSLLLVLALIPVSIYAEENNTSAPDVSVFAKDSSPSHRSFLMSLGLTVMRYVLFRMKN